MKISILTLFPEMFHGVFEHSILKLALEKKLIDISFVNIRHFGRGRHNLVDDTPYGGGAGMVMRVDVIDAAITKASAKGGSASGRKSRERIILLDPQGKTFTQKKAKELAKIDHLIFICGRYEGVDERVRNLVDEEISIGDYVLTGGEIPAMAVIDSAVRLLPGVINKKSIEDESFSNSTVVIPGKTWDPDSIDSGSEAGMTKETTLEYPQYTRPASYKNQSVPEILLTGDHKKISEWRKKEALKKTKKQRPDLLTKGR